MIDSTFVKCKNCNEKFFRRGTKTYCSGACRWSAWYKSRHLSTVPPCVYCGLPAGTKDHVPPQCVRPFLESVGEKRFAFLVVPACSECNCALGAKTLWTVRERKEYIKRWLERRYRADLSIPGWSVDEIKSLGQTLAMDVVAGLARRDLTRRRLAW